MFNVEEVKGYSKLRAPDKKVFRRFCERFYKAWEHPEKHEPIEVYRMDSKYLKVILSDGDWLHVTKTGDWF